MNPVLSFTLIYPHTIPMIIVNCNPQLITPIFFLSSRGGKKYKMNVDS